MSLHKMLWLRNSSSEVLMMNPPHTIATEICVSNLGNQTFQFFLLGLSDLTHSRIPLVLLFLLIYFITIAENLLIIVLVVTDSHLQTPMYFFLGNLSVIDIATPSVTVSHLPADIFSGKKLISYSNCTAQIFFYTWFVTTEVFILSVMSYDRYVAICHPLHYTTIMSICMCIRLEVIAWVFGFMYSLMHSLPLLRLSFYEFVTIEGSFCELYQLIQLSCSDTYFNNLLIHLSGIYIVAVIAVSLIPYTFIFKAVKKIKMEDGGQKAFSTCSSHLTVVAIFYGTIIFNYFLPKPVAAGRVLSVIYTVFIAFLNPIIYSLRNKQLKSALHRILAKVRFGPKPVR
ncbi:olfactory receptor 5B21-like [Hyperolius riggenbachi]|uniref:olfactory receptor 5B21-like n=1 Tax=Hyperolius riggenbachi TaxID=752182 RepID=UPI0035A34DCF